MLVSQVVRRGKREVARVQSEQKTAANGLSALQEAEREICQDEYRQTLLLIDVLAGNCQETIRRALFLLGIRVQPTATVGGIDIFDKDLVCGLRSTAIRVPSARSRSW